MTPGLISMMRRKHTILTLLRKHPNGLTLKDIRRQTGMESKALLETLSAMVHEGDLETATDIDGHRIYLRRVVF